MSAQTANAPAARERPGAGHGGLSSMPTQSSQKPRRVRVKGATGVYYRPLPGGGRRYEVGYLDSDKVQRWEVVDGDLEAAKAYRADVVARLGHGEQVRKTDETLGEYAERWLDQQRGRLRPTTIQWYEIAVRKHVVPALGRRKLQSIRIDDVADLVAQMRANGKSASTARGVLTPLGRIFATAVRRGLIPSNPVRGLERAERPRGPSREMRILTANEIPKLIAACPERYRLLLELSLATGIRQGEALGLVWRDVDLDRGTVEVRKQLGRDGQRADPKTERAKRSIPLPPSVARRLREHKERAFGLGRAKGDDFVFASETGGPLQARNLIRRGLGKAIEGAGLDGDGPSIRWHDLRHTYASVLIGQGIDVVYVSRRLGHSSPATTLAIYAHLWAETRKDELATDALEAALGGKPLENDGGERRRTPEPAGAEKVALLRAPASGGE
jgi:integrase